MPISLDLKPDAADWRTIHLSDGSFEVQIARPSWESLCADVEAPFGFMAARLKSVITGWRGLLAPDGKEIPFDEQTLELVCGQSAAVFNQLSRIVNGMYQGLTEDAEKNSDGPPSDPSPEETNQPAP